MPLHLIFRKLRQVGPITIGTGQDRDGHMTYIAACGAERCGWSGEYATVAAANVAAEGHRCRVR
ncbi:mobile element transfer protein [Streptomyces indicus]|uniref:Mobile element transfer protein n=1 Tax=Streptomyces indicus TaxID=417292 RepID=A0A1G9GC23_9ACTN|nr:mobile element transfer protein [Streptomyces indicus]SDK98258.1 Mobile element transfer protein [Streptomyces indicus]